MVVIPTQEEFTNGEIITLTVSMALTVVMQMQQRLPQTSRNARKIKVIEAAVLDLVRGSGEKVREEMSEYWVGCWNTAMQLAQDGITSEIERRGK